MKELKDVGISRLIADQLKVYADRGIIPLLPKISEGIRQTADN